ncbi:hypothetical protein GU927_005995 [Rhodobacteraceae bacterium HSP-20]|uniref:HTH LytTR-type domain-containing protein n=1 Tax=Paragemmobacter amnigenus TaxID=2852097 RepID=A0ABS6J1V5_9RHOB|nr:LytTR family transcriptional regulator [Rhodobacter amnigenus]MBU9697397.1 hypothetical protein [Rhodobacter amnigenus]MBV4388624.1 hypothetical protein [Rhodobacter amnigenus]
MPVSDRTKAAPIPVRLLFLGPFALTERQILGLFTHRYVLLLVFCCVVPTFWAQFSRDDGSSASIGLVTLFQLALATSVVLGLQLLWGRVVLHRGKGSVHLSPLILLGVIAAAGTGRAVSPLFGTDDLSDWRGFAILVLVGVATGELAAHFCARFMLEGILAELSGAPAAAAPEEPRPAAAPLRPEPRAILLGQTRIPVDALRSVQAAGNRVNATLRSGRVLTATTSFSSVTDQLAPQDGIAISRSVWLAATENPVPLRKAGELFLRLDDGSEWKVARPRRHDVQAWLESRA